MDVNNTTQDNSILTIPPPIPLGYNNNYTNSTSGSQNLTNILSGSYNYTNSIIIPYAESDFIIYVGTCIIIAIGLPLTLIAIYSLYSQVRNDHVAPIYVINLLISDIVQLCYMICVVALPQSVMKSMIDVTIAIIFQLMYIYSLMTSVCFMVCIALERYLLIVFPLWYRCRRTIKSTVVICVVAWVLPSLYFLISIVFLLLPFPLLIFFCCATLKALSASVSILPEEKRRIVGTLVLMLLIYTLLFLPYIICSIVLNNTNNESPSNTVSYLNTLVHLSPVFLELNPLADLILYIFMKKGALDKILASVCCCRVADKDVSSLENNTNV
ncbi:mas-related G-protein coupled receptor member B2-like [Perca fluviatilis]|uniref:mas-related G-protein coupled receptor member B2-like n=1 Tax=Perca fluviatilis TaxID=8168 RepID=UPI001963C72C|nr:mas-related G-protein coupled receptor member B2-like [Perca fluviatilis]